MREKIVLAAVAISKSAIEKISDGDVILVYGWYTFGEEGGGAGTPPRQQAARGIPDIGQAFSEGR